MTRLLLLAARRGCEVTFSPNHSGDMISVSVDLDGSDASYTIEMRECENFESQELELLLIAALIKLKVTTREEAVTALLD